jgi:hypothetical protein
METSNRIMIHQATRCLSCTDFSIVYVYADDPFRMVRPNHPGNQQKKREKPETSASEEEGGGGRRKAPKRYNDIGGISSKKLICILHFRQDLLPGKRFPLKHEKVVLTDLEGKKI